MTIQAFFLAGPPWTLGFVTRISLEGNGVEVASFLGTSSYTPSRLNDSISSQTACIHSGLAGLASHSHPQLWLYLAAGNSQALLVAPKHPQHGVLMVQTAW